VASLAWLLLGGMLASAIGKCAFECVFEDRYGIGGVSSAVPRCSDVDVKKEVTKWEQ